MRPTLLSWPEFKALLAVKVGVGYEHVQTSNAIEVSLHDGGRSWQCNLITDESDGGYDAGGLDEWNTSYASHSNRALLPRAQDGRMATAVGKGTSPKRNFYSHNFCDTTTWYGSSVFVEENAVRQGDGTYTFPTAEALGKAIIDLAHGKLFGEDQLVDSENRSYRVEVRVDGVLLAEKDPHWEYMINAKGRTAPPGYTPGYAVNYETRRITFVSDPGVSAVVSLKYHYATTSLFRIKPQPGKRLLLSLAEVQYSLNVNPMDTLCFDTRMPVEVFVAMGAIPGAAVGTDPGQIPPGTMLPVPDGQYRYKTLSDAQTDAMRAYPTYNAFGDPANWRAQPYGVTVFDWDYAQGAVIQSSLGVEVWLYLEHDEPFEGYLATATFYCVEEDE